MPQRTASKAEKQAPGSKAGRGRLPAVLCKCSQLCAEDSPRLQCCSPPSLKRRRQTPAASGGSTRRPGHENPGQAPAPSTLCPRVRKHLASKGLPLKVLILDNTPGHPKPYTEGTKGSICYRNTTSLIQPLHQGGAKTFKAYYTLSSTERTVNTMFENSDRESIMEVRKDHTTEDASLL